MKEVIPEELEIIWDPAVAEAFHALLPKPQLFLIEYLKSWNASEAYRKAYNPLARDEVASANGSRLIASDKVGVILAKFSERRTEALFRATKTYFDLTEATKPEWVKGDDGEYENAGDAPDWKARKDGADGLCKIYGLNSPEKVEDDRLTALLAHMNRPKEDSNVQAQSKPEVRKPAGKRKSAGPLGPGRAHLA